MGQSVINVEFLFLFVIGPGFKKDSDQLKADFLVLKLHANTF